MEDDSYCKGDWETYSDNRLDNCQRKFKHFEVSGQIEIQMGSWVSISINRSSIYSVSWKWLSCSLFESASRGKSAGAHRRVGWELGKFLDILRLSENPWGQCADLIVWGPLECRTFWRKLLPQVPQLVELCREVVCSTFLFSHRNLSRLITSESKGGRNLHSMKKLLGLQDYALDTCGKGQKELRSVV